MSSMSKYFKRKKESDLLDNPPSFYRRHLLSSCSTYTILILNSLWLIQVSSLNAMKEEEACYSIKSTSTQKIENQKTNYHEDHPLTREFWKTCDISDRLKDLNKKISLIKNDLILHKISLNAHIKDNLDNYKKILRCTQCSASSVQNLKDIHLKTLDSYIDRENPEKPQGWSANTEVILFPCKSSQTLLTEGKKRPPLVAIKKFKDEKDTDNGIVKGLTELICSLLALEMNPAPERLKMAQIFDAVICPQNSLSIIMEAVPGKDIHTCLSTNSATNVVKACAEYLALFHIENHQKLNKNINRREFLKHAANFSNSLLQDTLEEEHNIYKLLSLTPREQLSEDTDIKSHNVILLLSQKNQKKLKCLTDVSLNLFRKNTENIFRSLQNIAEKVPYFLTRNHGDAHAHNFFYDNSPLTHNNQEILLDSFYRIGMIDFATIFNTLEQTGDPAEDVGRILAALRNWSIIAQDTCNNEDKVTLLKREFIEHYLNKIKKSNIIEPENREDFERIFKENAVVYELRYYRAIFNVKKHHELAKDKEIKRRFLKSWIKENKALESFAKELDQQNIFKVNTNDRSWNPVCTYKEPIVHWLPDWSNEFIESTTEDRKISYLTSLWQMLNDTRAVTLSSKATLAGMGGIGKTTLALAYGHEALANNAYHVIYWIYGGTEDSILKGYKELLLKMGAVEAAKIPITEKERIIKLLQEKLPPRSLLIYDNVPEFYDDIPSPTFLKDLIPDNKNTHILMTSRRNEGWNNLSLNTHSLNLKVFCLKDSLEYLFKVTGLERNSDNEKIAGDLAESLGHFPLALAHAAHYLKLVGGNNVTAEHFESYLSEFYAEEAPSYFENRTNYLKDRKSKLSYENLIARTLYVSESYLKKKRIFEPAKELLAYCSYLHPDTIQEEIFLEYWPNEEEKAEAINKVFEELAALSLIKKNKTEPIFSIHRLVQLVIRGEAEANKDREQNLSFLNTVKIFNNIFKYIIDKEWECEKIISYLPHIMTLNQYTEHLDLTRDLAASQETVGHLVWVEKFLTALILQEYTEKFISKQSDAIISQKVKNPKLRRRLQNLMETKDSVPNWIKEEIINKGHSGAHATIGLMYKLGICTMRDYGQARFWYTIAMNLGNNFATLSLAEMYADGVGGEKDYIESEKCYLQLPNITSDMHYNLGLLYSNNQEPLWNLTKAFNHYYEAANQGNEEAQCNLGIMYYKGEGVTQSYNTARFWLNQASNKEHAGAQYNLGTMYYNGHGVEKNFLEAFSWYILAAYQGHTEAQSYLGVMYYFALGVDEDFDEAFRWSTLAAEQQNARAQYQLGLMYYNGQGTGKNFDKALNCFRLAADTGCMEAQVHLGLIHANEIKNDEEASKWFILAANQGSANAECALGEMYLSARGVAQSDDAAFTWFKRAANQGNAAAQYYLGLCYLNGWGTTEDELEALKCFKKAAQQGHEKAREMIQFLGAEEWCSLLLPSDDLQIAQASEKGLEHTEKDVSSNSKLIAENKSENTIFQKSFIISDQDTVSSPQALPQTPFDTVTTSTTTATTTMSICTAQSSSQSMNYK